MAAFFYVLIKEQARIASVTIHVKFAHGIRACKALLRTSLHLQERIASATIDVKFARGIRACKALLRTSLHL